MDSGLQVHQANEISRNQLLGENSKNSLVN